MSMPREHFRCRAIMVTGERCLQTDPLDRQGFCAWHDSPPGPTAAFKWVLIGWQVGAGWVEVPREMYEHSLKLQWNDFRRVPDYFWDNYRAASQAFTLANDAMTKMPRCYLQKFARVVDMEPHAPTS